MSSYDPETGQEKQPSGEYGFDYDSGEVVYHYGDGFATSPDGRQQMEADGGHAVDLETNEVHYAPTEVDPVRVGLGYGIFWLVAGIVCAFLCIVFIKLLLDPETNLFLRYLFDAVMTGLGAFYCFSKLKKQQH